MLSLKRLLLSALAALACHCTPVPGPGPMPHDADADVPPVVDRDAAPASCAQPGPLDDCRQAGENLCRLGCTEGGQPLWHTPKGTPYAEACRRAKLDGRDTTASGGSRAQCLAAMHACAMETCR